MVSADPATAPAPAPTSADRTEKALLTARLTAPGGPFALVEREVGGVPMRVYAEGPQTLRDVEAAGDKTRMVLTTHFDSLEGMEQAIAMGVVDGMKACMSQIDALLAGVAA